MTGSSHRLPWALLAAAAALYIAYLPYYFVGYFGDDALYVLAAKSLLQGRYVFLSIPGEPPFAHFLPGFPLFLAPFVRLAEPAWGSLKGLSIIVSLASVILAWRLFGRWMAPRQRWMAASLFALHPVSALFSGTVLSDPFYLLLTLAAFCLVDLLADKKQNVVWLSLVLAWAAVVRPNGILTAVSVGVALIHLRRHRSAVRILLPVVFIWGGVLLRNAAVTGPTSTYYWRDWVKSLGDTFQSGSSVLEKMIAFLQTICASGLWALPIPPPAWLGSGLVVLLSGGAIALAAIGWAAMRPRLEQKPSFVAAGVFGLLHLGVLFFWQAHDVRYLLPALPFLIAAIVEGGRWIAARHPGGRWTIYGVLALWTVGMAWAHGQRIPDGYRSDRSPEHHFPADLFAWARTHTAPEAVFLSPRAPTIYLYGERQAYLLNAMPDRETFRYWLTKRRIQYIAYQNVPILMGARNPLWQACLGWMKSIPAVFEPVFMNESDGTVVFQYVEDPRFVRAFETYLRGLLEIDNGNQRSGIEKLRRAHQIYPGLPESPEERAAWNR